MRSNLVFYNLPEVDKEDSFATVRDVLANKMEIDANNEIEIEREHRLVKMMNLWLNKHSQDKFRQL